jgi:hypothetical protein
LSRASNAQPLPYSSPSTLAVPLPRPELITIAKLATEFETYGCKDLSIVTMGNVGLSVVSFCTFDYCLFLLFSSLM